MWLTPSSMARNEESSGLNRSVHACRRYTRAPAVTPGCPDRFDGVVSGLRRPRPARSAATASKVS